MANLDVPPVNGGELALAETFLRESAKIADLGALSALMDDLASELGFRHFALIHHDDARNPSPGLVHLQNYPAYYADRYVADCLHLEDPVLHACLTTHRCFVWSQLGEMISLTDRHRKFLARGAAEGLYDGITVPACPVGGRIGSCTLSGPRRSVDPARRVGAVQIIGPFAFHAAHRIVTNGALRPVRVVRLHPRQRECVVLAGQGKSNGVIAQILGLRPSTVKSYLEDARRRYDVSSKAQLIVAATLDGEINLSEIAPRQYR